MSFQPASDRYQTMRYNRCGKSGVQLPAVRGKLQKLNAIAQARGQSLAQMSLAWVLRGGKVTSVLIGASKPSQIDDCVGTLKNLSFSGQELASIDAALAG